MKKIYIVLLMSVCLTHSYAQLNYAPSSAQNLAGTYTDLGTNGTVITTADFDDSNSSPINIGFTFRYGCTDFTQFILNTNGFIKLGSVAPSSASLYYAGAQSATGGVFNSTSPLDVNIISPFNHDLIDTAAFTPEYRVFTSGTAGSQVTTIQWKNIREYNYGTPAVQYAKIEFQVKLYEGTNVIEFVYGIWTPTANTDAFKTSAVGLKGTDNSSANIVAVTKGSTTAWSSAVFLQGNYTGNTHNFRRTVAPDAGRTYRFTPTATFSQDANIRALWAKGKMAHPSGSPDTIMALVSNSGCDSLNSLNVTLNITGANTYTNTQTITLAPGQSDTLQFAFTPTAMGLNSVAVSVPADDNSLNNSKNYQMEVTPDIYSYADTSAVTGSLGFGTNSGFILTKYRINNTRQVDAVNVFIAASALNKNVYGVVLDNLGNIVGQSNTVTITATDTGRVYSFSITVPPSFTGSDFYAGLAQVASATAYYPVGTQTENPGRNNAYYYSPGLTGGTAPVHANTFGRFYIQAVVSCPVLPTVVLTPGDTTVCSGATVMFTASGANTYTWTPAAGLSATTGSTVTATIDTTITYIVTGTDADGCSNSDTTTITALPNTLSLATSTTDADCGVNNGTATVTVSGGASPYMYVWTNADTTATADTLSAGTYTVTVTDNAGCTKTANATVANLNAPVVNVSTDNITCKGASDGIAIANVTGGTAPYTYSWNTTSNNDTINNLAPGAYTVTVTDANNCSAAASGTITEPTELLASATGTNVMCNGANTGTATASASGGTTPYTYVWPNGDNSAMADSLIAGAYTVTVTDANLCTKTATYTVTQPTAIAATATGISVTCFGGNNGSATVSVSGGVGPYTYAWSTTPVKTTATASNLTASAYTVTVTDANLCTKTASYTVAQPDSISISGDVTDNALVGSINTTVTGGTSPYTYSWLSTVAGYSSTEADPDSIMTQGTYTVTVTDANNCTNSRTFTIAGSVTIKEAAQNSSSVKIYPNPNNGQFTIQLSEMKKGDYNFELRNILGQVIYAETVNVAGSFTKALNFSTLSKGVYFLNVNGETTTTTQRIVIK